MFTVVWVGPNGTVFAREGFNHPKHIENWARKYLDPATEYIAAVTQF